MCEMWKMCNFMFTFCAYLAEGSLVAGSGTGSGLWDKPRPSTCVAFASYFVCAMCVCVCVCTIFWSYSWVNLTNCRMAQAKSDQASKRAATTTTSTKIQPTFWDTFEHMSNVCMFSVCICKEGNTAVWYVWTNDY